MKQTKCSPRLICHHKYLLALKDLRKLAPLHKKGGLPFGPCVPLSIWAPLGKCWWHTPDLPSLECSGWAPKCLWNGWIILKKPLVFKYDCADLLMPAVNSFSHQTWSALAWSPGLHGGQKEKVGRADYKEVNSRVQHGGEVPKCWWAAERGPGRHAEHRLRFLALCRKVIFLSGCQLRNSVPCLFSELPSLMVITTQYVL